MARTISVVLAVVVLALGVAGLVALVQQDLTPTELVGLSLGPHAGLWIVIPGIALLGFVVALLLVTPARLEADCDLRALRRRLRDAQEELADRRAEIRRLRAQLDALPGHEPTDGAESAAPADTLVRREPVGVADSDRPRTQPTLQDDLRDFWRRLRDDFETSRSRWRVPS